MHRRRIGRTALKVTALGFGGAPLGNSLAPVSDKEAAETVGAAWAGGCRYFDTSPFYGYGLGERRLGDQLRSHPRNDYVLSSKVGRLIRLGNNERERREKFPGSLPFRAVYDYSYDGVMRS